MRPLGASTLPLAIVFARLCADFFHQLAYMPSRDRRTFIEAGFPVVPEPLATIFSRIGRSSRGGG